MQGSILRMALGDVWNQRAILRIYTEYDDLGNLISSIHRDGWGLNVHRR